MKHIFITTSILLVLLFIASCNMGGQRVVEEPEIEDIIPPKPIVLRYGLDVDGYELSSHTIKMGQTVGAILSKYGITPLQIDRLDRASKEIFPLKKIRGGNSYTLLLKPDSAGVQRLEYMAYEQNNVDYALFSFVNDSISVTLGQKPTRRERLMRSAEINSSLWGAIMAAGLPYALASQMEDVYQWTVDFFGIQSGDSFTVIYDEVFVDDSTSVGVGQLWGAKFTHNKRDYYAIPFKQGARIEYWEEDGASLKKQMLKAPLKYSRISSKFSHSRLHPIHKVYRPHHGVDYAAPTGTPVHSVADGVITQRAYAGGGGNTIKIKHAGNLMTGYLHLSRFADGIKVGSRVSQGQLIGYVGSTGTSTGPHLDYRIWKNGVAINPLTIPQEPSEPIWESNKAEFKYISSHIIDELNGEGSPAELITRLDTLYTTSPILDIAESGE